MVVWSKNPRTLQIHRFTLHLLEGISFHRSPNRTLMKKIYLLVLLLVATLAAPAQFVDTLYHYRDTTLTYGTAIDAGGNVRSLDMDISIPTDDSPPPNGRPLMVLIHGGGFISGTKSDPAIRFMREDFAKRGYVTAAIDYRLGMIQTNLNFHCNVSLFVPWDCLNQSDTLEWMRAYYRGIQDGHGAIRYLVNHAADYGIDPQNVFVVGESAGAFIAMGVGYMDDPSEIPPGVGAIAAAPAPNAIYDQACVQAYQLDTNIASLNLSRPDLGSYLGTMNYPANTTYRIRGVGDLYGAVFQNLFAVNANDAAIPCLYLFHQPDDLIVPFGKQRVFAPYAYCCVTNFGCAYITNRPFVSGGSDIRTMIDALAANGDSVPHYQAEFTSNNYDCLYQIANGATCGCGHALDNYWLRTSNMAVFFNGCVDTMAVAVKDPFAHLAMQVFPNPSAGEFRVVLPSDVEVEAVSVMDLVGRMVLQESKHGNAFRLQMSAAFARGPYLLRVKTSKGVVTRRIILE